jgi:hypothetical protein
MWSLVRVLAIVIVLWFAGCTPAKPPTMRVVGVHQVVLLELSNPTRHPLRMTRLHYVFASAGSQISSGVVELERDVAPGAVMVTEVPTPASETPITISGELTTEHDQVIRTFRVSARL